MNRFKTAALFLVASVVLISCGSTKDYTESAEAFGAMKSELDGKFGEGAYYTQISLVNDRTVGNMMMVTYTTAPSSMEMEEWKKFRGAWELTADVTIDTGNQDPTRFMFNLEEDIDLSMVGNLMEDAKKRFTKEMDIENPFVSMVSLITPDRDYMEAMLISIDLEPENGGTRFTYLYNLQGELENVLD